MSRADPHADAQILRAGPSGAARGLVLIHGRGAQASDIAGLAMQFAPADTAVAAPQAAGSSWWPVSFLAPDAVLAPWVASAIGAVDRAVEALVKAGLPQERVGLAGFSQGACLALEYAARRGGRWHSVLALSGGLVGTGDASDPLERDALYGHRDKAFDYEKHLEDVPVLLACHDRDPHIPAARVRRSAEVLGAMGAGVTTRLHPGAQHGMGPGDDAAVRTLWQG
ncbi:alpha/beta hydrolase [Roseicitreum antarcticum]|uniref:Phospholipase/carboxylesterase n=1 Tax=Roseicitreum antarcticum TaxID=564137 RepID=A0A1H2U2B2_9RHOB|nr:dienelactone hydrolase family protein [Roseicitreum antarcticum]SDW50353.1 phospholipase/carboxylesterase [Roseicitreum antarcticum]